MGNMNNMDSVFDGAMNNDIEFDTIFDQEDSLVDIVEGYGNGTDPVDDFCLESAEGTEEAEVLDNSVDEKEIGKESDIDKFLDGNEEEYHKGEDGPKPDETSVEDTIDKVVESSDDIDDFFDDDDDDLLDEACKNEGCKKEEGEVDLGPEEEEPVKEEADVTIDSIEEDIEKEAEAAEKDMQKDEPDCAVKEAGDPEVEKVEKAEDESDEDLIDIAMGQEENDSAEEKYAYDISDEDLIDIAMNND